MMSVFLTTYQGAILGPIARLLGYILQGLYSVLSVVGIENTGICMILFTFIVNALMIPMQIKQQKFAKMSSVIKKIRNHSRKCLLRHRLFIRNME